MAQELAYKKAAASGYDRTFGHVSARFVPPLLRAARLEPGMRVLDIATGTGLAAEAALAVVDSSGHVTAADISPEMAEKARGRLDGSPHASVTVENGQAMSFPDRSFDAVLCSLGLMFFPDPAQALSEFHRVLRPGGRAAVSVVATAERLYDGQVFLALARAVPSLAAAATCVFLTGQEARLRSLFEGAGFRNVEISTETRHFVVPSFDAYFEPYEQGGGMLGQAYMTLPEEQRRVVREDVRRGLGDTGGAIEIEMDVRLGTGQR